MGWMKEQVQQNLDGFTGRLDSLVPGLIVQDSIYGKDRLTKHIKHKDVGALGDTGDWQVQFLWWNSETQSNWWDGYIRSAILSGDQHHLERVKKHVEYILSTQDNDGYIGIYDKDLRYQFNNENGELWAQATVLRGLLAWYEYSKDQIVLTAIKRSVKNVMDHYPINRSHPFNTTNPNVGGLSHGLMFIDVLEGLNRITADSNYADYTLFLYQDFSEQTLNEDAQYKKLMDPSLALNGHGVHVYEHLRAVAAASYISGNPNLYAALQNYLNKISITTTATGGPIGDEWIGRRKANSTSAGYEYCSLQELLHSYSELLIKSGNSNYAEKIEKLFFNAAQGARLPKENCIAYLKSDNSYYMTGGLNGDTSVKNQTRYKYSPVHQDAAVCCVPNAGRITPYYIQNMWQRQGNNLVTTLLGPCVVTTTLSGKKIQVKEITSYPFSSDILFEVSGQGAIFDLKIRKPTWSEKVVVSENYKEENGFIIIRKKWDGKRTIKIRLFPSPVAHEDNNEEVYFSYGPLVLAHPLHAHGVKTRSFPLKGYYDWQYKPDSLIIYRYGNKPITQERKNSLLFFSELYDPQERKYQRVELVPMGQTILRQVTFKKESL